MGALSTFDIDISPGDAKIVVDGEEISHVVSLKFEAGVGEVPRLTLERFRYQNGHLSGEAEINWSSPEPDQRELVLRFLENLDADEVEKDMLARCGGFGGDESTGEAFLQVLRGYLGGDDNGS